ncbi:WD repeat-containing protein 76 [Trichonephila clavata]|uniref:WD repeat-containing protein 76 n=1 Tax=Trichonephila clavata TaxID=2740835 RepID=A0A8X6F0Y9_TRICU|nr:WD repeat-containing protein 76 [Trichonephila clavata]
MAHTMNRIPLCDITTCEMLSFPLGHVFQKRLVKEDNFEEEYFNSKTKMESETKFNKSKMKRKNVYKEAEDEVKKIKEEEDKEDIKPSKLSEYEKMIQKNREEQIAFLESLRMTEVKEEFKEAVRSLKPRKPKKIKVPKAVQAQQLPTRKSLRLAKIDIDMSEEAMAARAVAEAEKELKEVKLEPVLSFKDAITLDDYDDFVHHFKDIDFKGSAKPFKDYVSHFKSMKIDESRVARVVNGRITAVAIHPMQEKIIVSVGNKFGAVGLWHVNSDTLPFEFKPHLQGITNIQFNPDVPNMLYTSSYDGTMRSGDLEHEKFIEIYNVSDESSCTYFDFLSSTSFLVSHRNGTVSVVDNRSDQTWMKRHKCHEYSVKTISIHPVDKNYFISAETKGCLALWDLRKLQKKPVTQVHHHKRVVYSAFFSPVTGNSVLTTSADDSICLLDTSVLGNPMFLQKSLKHNNWTGRWLSTFKATWLPNTDDTFVVGSMNPSRRIEIFDHKMNNIFNFDDEYFNCITSVNAFHPSLPVLAGCNSSGKVYVFAE